MSETGGNWLAPKALHSPHSLHSLHSLHSPHSLHSLHSPHSLHSLHSLHSPHSLHSLHSPGSLHSLHSPGSLHSLHSPGSLSGCIKGPSGAGKSEISDEVALRSSPHCLQTGNPRRNVESHVASLFTRQADTGYKRTWTLVERDDVSAMWAAEYAGDMTEAAKQLQQTAREAEKSCSQALTSRQAPKLTSLDELEPEERELALRARSMSHASALLSLLAIEIALKGWQILDCGKHTRGHDLQCLFDSLKTETKAHLKELCPEVTETLSNHPNGFVSLRYQFEELGKSKGVVPPKPSDPLHTAVTRIVEDLMEEPRVQQVATRRRRTPS